MPAPDLLSILERLNHAYPEKHLTTSSFKLYIEHLQDIPPVLLDEVVNRHIQSSPWFPHISELRQSAQQLAGVASFSSLGSPGTDYLDVQALQLHNDYYHRGRFDPLEWDHLVSQLEHIGRLCRAQELRLKARHIQENEEAVRRGEQYPSRAACQRYARYDHRAGEPSP